MLKLINQQLSFFLVESGFQTIVESFVARGSRSASVHPINGEVYTFGMI